MRTEGWRELLIEDKLNSRSINGGWMRRRMMSERLMSTSVNKGIMERRKIRMEEKRMRPISGEIME